MMTAITAIMTLKTTITTMITAITTMMMATTTTMMTITTMKAMTAKGTTGTMNEYSVKCHCNGYAM